MRAVLMIVVLSWASSLFANSTGDTLRCLVAINGSEKFPFYMQLSGAQGVYVTEQNVYRTGLGGQDFFQDVWYQYVKINKDTGADGVCIKCQQMNCKKYSLEWKNSKDFPKDCDKYSQSFSKTTEEHDLNWVIEQSFVSMTTTEPPDKLAEAKKLRDKIEKIPLACEGAAHEGFDQAMIDGFVQQQASTLKEKFNLSTNLKAKNPNSRSIAQPKAAKQ